MEIDVFDFDRTLYDGDCTVDFFVFCLRRRPFILFLLPVIGVSLLLYIARVISMEKLKSAMFLYLRFLREGEVDVLIKTFWDTYGHKLNAFFTHDFMERESVVISASPETIVARGCYNRGINHVIGTSMDMRTGRTIGKNCRHEEKLVRLAAIYPDAVIIRAFSDSPKADGPLLKAAAKPYIVRHGVISPFDDGQLAR